MCVVRVRVRSSLLHAGFGAFRHAVLLHPVIVSALSRHLKHAASLVMAHGGFTSESGRLMQLVRSSYHVLAAFLGGDDYEWLTLPARLSSLLPYLRRPPVCGRRLRRSA